MEQYSYGKNIIPEATILQLVHFWTKFHVDIPLAYNKENGPSRIFIASDCYERGKLYIFSARNRCY